jgi:hypothetical protein
MSSDTRRVEVADMLGSTVPLVTSALKRAHTNVEPQRPSSTTPEPPPPPDSHSELALVGKFVNA